MPSRPKPNPAQEELPLSSIAPRSLFPGRTSLLLTEVAAALRVTTRTVLGWIETGELLAVDTGNGSNRKHMRVPVSAYEEFLKRRKTV